MKSLSRRSFLLGSAAGAVLVACGGSSGSSDAPDDPNAIAAMNARFQDGTLTTPVQRVPVVLTSKNGIIDAGPELITATVVDAQGKEVGEPVTAVRRAQGLPTPFWSFELALATPGLYQLKSTVDGTNVDLAFNVLDPAQVTIPQPGQKLPSEVTPTIADPRSVNPICTRQPVCPLHTESLSDVLTAGRPVAYLIGTPAHCQTAVCGPVLDFMLQERERRGDAVAMVHAEVYTDNTLKTPTSAVQAYTMTFEPALFLADATGTITQRLDSVWDAEELRAALDRIN